MLDLIQAYQAAPTKANAKKVLAYEKLHPALVPMSDGEFLTLLEIWG
jgi:hypothetical protein